MNPKLKSLNIVRLDFFIVFHINYVGYHPNRRPVSSSRSTAEEKYREA